MTCGEYLIRFLLSQDVRVGFGIPGALNAHLYEAMRALSGEFRHVLVRHELGGGWMADGFARARNDVGVVFTVPGPGATHAASAVAGAYTECSRLLAISAGPATSLRGELRRDLFHGLDQQRLFAPITKWTAAVRSPGELPELLGEAFYHLRRGRPGPVHLEIPSDLFGRDAGSAPLPGFITAPPAAPDAARVHEAAAALRSARRPLLLAGDGVLHAGASEALGALASTLRAPVVTTVMGKGALPEDHPWSLGDSNSPAGAAAYPEHDLLLAVGARFVQVDTRWRWFTRPRRLVHLDADAREIGRVYPAEVGLVGDVRVALEQLQAALRESPGGRSGWDERFPPLKRTSDAREAHWLFPALREALPREAIVAWDVSQPGFLARREWPTYEPYTHLYTGVYVAMGFGLPAAIGAKLARPERPVCVVTGDACFQMTQAELATAVQSEVPLVIVLINDGGYCQIRAHQDREFNGRRHEVDLVNPDFLALAAAYGVPARRVTTAEALTAAVGAAVASGRLSLVELAVPPDYLPPDYGR